MRGISQQRRSEALADIVALTMQIEAADYRPESYSFVDLEDLPAPSAATTSGNFHLASVKSAGESYQVFSNFTKILVTRQALVNDDRGFVRAAVNAFTAHAHRNEMATIAQTEFGRCLECPSCKKRFFEPKETSREMPIACVK